MVEFVLKITARVSGVPAMIQGLAAVMFEARLERACVDCQLYSETRNPCSFFYVEQWSTAQDLESQFRSHRFGMLLEIMETAAQAPSLEVRTISEQRGLEYVRGVRLQPDANNVRKESPDRLADLRPQPRLNKEK